MSKSGKKLNYILGIDLGPASIGWAVVECDKKGEPLHIQRAGAHRFDAGVSGDIEKGKDESRATKRREARGPRRNQWRRQWRMRKVYRALMYHGLLPAAGADFPTGIVSVIATFSRFPRLFWFGKVKGSHLSCGSLQFFAP